MPLAVVVATKSAPLNAGVMGVGFEEPEGVRLDANTVPLLVPCHRVVPKSGGVGNYGFGPARKRVLLAREGATVDAERG